MPELQQQELRGGELNAAVTSALVGIHTKYLGRGPRTASTFHHNNVLVTLMQAMLTQAERTLVEHDRGETVHDLRSRFQEVMREDFRAAVERLTGRRVTAFVSGNQVEEDIAAELFVLDGPL